MFRLKKRGQFSKHVSSIIQALWGVRAMLHMRASDQLHQSFKVSKIVVWGVNGSFPEKAGTQVKFG